jgi:predicted permease
MIVDMVFNPIAEIFLALLVGILLAKFSKLKIQLSVIAITLFIVLYSAIELLSFGYDYSAMYGILIVGVISVVAGALGFKWSKKYYKNRS